ncbi:MAG: hypothetical protein IPL90_19935 [Holophagales bacterium]|nr:hypothetical protein [Holophagales bacterium]
MPPTKPLHEPHKIKTVRLIAFPTLEERKRNLAQAHFNAFNLAPSQVSFDMPSYGTSAMSQDQIAGASSSGDEAYAGARNFGTLVSAVNRVLGHTYVCPTHNSLGAVKLLVATLILSGSSSRATRAAGWTSSRRCGSRSPTSAITTRSSSPATSTSRASRPSFPSGRRR